MSDAGAAAAAVIGLYRRHAALWRRQRGDGLGPERGWLARFLALVPPGGTILDVGCGPGVPIARHLLARGFRVTGIDAAPEMLALAREAMPDADWRLADMRTLHLGHRFDGVLVWHSLFHLPTDDQRRTIPRLAVHARPGAPLMFTSGPAAGTAIGSFGGDPLHHASLDGDEYRTILAGCGCTVVAHIVEDPDCGGATVWLARRAGSLPVPSP